MKLSLILLLFSAILFSQDLQYFDYTFKNPSTVKTPHHRIYSYKDDFVWFEDYFRDSILLQDGKIFGLKNKSDIDNFIYFSGSRARDINYKTSFINAKGEFTFYNPVRKEKKVFKSKKLSRVDVVNDTQRYIQIWDDEGNEKLKNGSGIDVSYSDNKEFKHIYTYVDSILIEGYTVRFEKGDTIYQIFETMAEPKEGFKAFYKKLETDCFNTIPNKIIKESQNTKIQFLVNRDGSLSEFEPIGKTQEIDSYIIKFLKTIPNWKPGTHRNKAIQTLYSLPVNIFQME